MGALFTNNCSSSLASSISAVSTSLAVSPGDGVLFPMLATSDWCTATLTKLVGGLPVHEIVKVTARAGDLLTIARAQEGTSAATFSAGDKISLNVTAGALNSKMDKGGGTFEGNVVMTDHALSGAALADESLTFHDADVANTIDYRDGHRQRWAPATGAQTLTITNWPPDPLWGELMLKVVDGGGKTLTSSVQIKWLKSDGTYATTTSINTNHGTTLQTFGIDRVALWKEEDGAVYGKVLR